VRIIAVIILLAISVPALADGIYAPGVASTGERPKHGPLKR
jgi:hypothetical protein